MVNAPLSVRADQGECFIDFADITILGRVENSNFQATFGDVYKGVYRRSGEGVNSCYLVEVPKLGLNFKIGLKIL